MCQIHQQVVFSDVRFTGIFDAAQSLLPHKIQVILYAFEVMGEHDRRIGGMSKLFSCFSHLVQMLQWPQHKAIGDIPTSSDRKND